MVLNEKQIQIIETAEELFADKGFDATSVRDIAEAAGVNVAMISYYFGSKEKLLETLFSFRIESGILTLEGIVQNKEVSTLQKVNTLIDYYIDKIQSRPRFHQIIMREQVTNFRGSTSALIVDVKKRNEVLITQLIQEGQRKEGFKKNIDVSLLMTTLIGTVSYATTSQHYYKEMNQLQHLSNDEMNQLLKKKLSTHLKKLFKALLTQVEVLLIQK